MPPPILRQKLKVPPAWPEALLRERPLQVLELAVTAGQHLVMVAGSGYGKTTLLADWARLQLQQEARAVAWLTLDAEDADLDAFLAYLLASIQQALPGFATAATALLPHAREREGAGAALDALMVDLDEQCDRPLVIILDDYHLPASPSLDGLIVRLLRYLPPLVRVIVASRRAPGFELAELRAKRRLALLDESLLAFDLQELGLLLPELSFAQRATRLATTGGWPAAMGLAPELLDAYLEEVVLGGQPPEIRALLERLALVDSFDTAYTHAVPGAALDAATREALLRQRLILASSPGRWTVPQPLGRMLRTHFSSESSPQRLREVLGAVAHTLWEGGQPLTALAMWLSAGDAPAASAKLVEVAESWLDENRLEALANGLAALNGPPTEPALALAEGELWRRWGDFERAERGFVRAVAGYQDRADATGLARTRLRQALAQASRGATDQARQLLAEARPFLAPGDAGAVDVLNLEGGLALFAGEARQAIAHYEAALALARGRGQRALEARALHNLGVCYTRLGDDDRALASYDAGLALASDDGVPAIWMTPINRALVLVYLERPAEAVRAAAEALELVRRFHLAREEGYALRILGYAHLREGRLEPAEACFDEAARLARRTEDRLGQAFTANFQAEAASLAGDHPKALAYLAEVEALLAGRPEREGLPEFAFTRARSLVAAGRLADARPVVLALLARAKAGGYKRHLVEAETLAALLEVAAAPVNPAPRLRATGPLPSLGPPELAIRCFGGLQVARAGQALAASEWQSFRAKVLLAYLLHTPEGATKERLFEVLFPNEQATEAAVNMTLMRLRKALEPGLEKGQLSRYVLRSGGSYVFNRQAPVRLDTQDFESALRASRQTTPEEEARLLDTALALYRGDFLPEFDQGWVLALRQRLRGRALDACRRRLELVPDDDPLIATELLHRALEIDPLADEFHRELILRFIEGEEPQRARAHFALVEVRYREALGAPPPEDLAALVAGI